MITTKPEPKIKFNNEQKKIIRSSWAKPLLAFLHQNLNKKLIYVGLPDVEAHDVIEWLDYLEIVYAFQCRDYPNPSSPTQSRQHILALENTLRSLERRKQIATYDVFDGYIEEVMVRGFDNSPQVKSFTQQDTVTVYNLDFCGQVTSPIEYVDRKGRKQKAYKFNAVQKLLDHQKNIEQDNKKFVLFLTLHCSYDGQEFTKFLANPHPDIKKYLEPIQKLSKGKKAPYAVKAFVYDQLTQFFTNSRFIPEFLPTLYYNGDNGHPLLFFTVLGTESENSSSIPAPLVTLNSLLKTPLVSIANDHTFAINNDLILPDEIKSNGVITSTGVFKSSKSYQQYWK
ncbi:hypothetical protein [uncultured Mucilaginibacter sp.]|uniref:hypothetical protein n=1 Tax=uncultured Mucilaginibacter sp. TaxID=797541 RepID=UPI002638C60D|nr:hypothetical protein [uncultured Mucilaginibacter sp.]